MAHLVSPDEGASAGVGEALLVHLRVNLLDAHQRAQLPRIGFDFCQLLCDEFRVDHI
jgi:hypothetical protein